MTLEIQGETINGTTPVVSKGYHFIGKDTGGGGSFSYSEVASIDVPPGDVEDFVELFSEIEVYMEASEGDTAYTDIRVKVDGSIDYSTPTGYFTRITSNDGTASVETILREIRIFNWYYEPTESQKQSGFTVSIEGQQANDTNANSIFTHIETILKGK